MPAPRVGLREFALLLTIALPLVANAADDPSEIGVVDRVENEANIVSGDNAPAAIIATRCVPVRKAASRSPSATRRC